jgi:hypothetical protein
MEAATATAAASGLQEAATVPEPDSSFPARPSISPVSSPLVQPVTSFDNSSQSSTTSQHSRAVPLQLSTSDVSSTALPAPNAAELTPPSSAGSPTRHLHHGSPDSLTPKKAADSSTGVSSRQLSPVRRARGDSTAGAKRTASGQIKSMNHTERPPPLAIDPNRTRASSSASASSAGNVVEVFTHTRSTVCTC